MNQKINLIKRFLFVILTMILVFITGCGKELTRLEFKDTSSFKTLGKIVEVNNETSEQKFDETIDPNRFLYLSKFASITSQKLFTKNKNYIYSPISLYMALSMLANGANGETLTELLNLLKSDNNVLTLNNINNDMNNILKRDYYKNNNGMLQFANSIWIKDGFLVKENYLNTLSYQYYADIYQTDFSNDAKENIVSWINHYTQDLLKMKKSDLTLSQDIVILLLNTVYFDNVWVDEFKKKDSYFDDFLNCGEKVEYMNHLISSTYYETDLYEETYDYFKNDSKIRFILPKEGITINDLLQNECISDLHLGETKYASINLSLPKFKTTSKYELNDIIKDLGVKKIFDVCDFSNIADEEICVSMIKQDAGIELSETGVKAAAVTSIGMDCESSQLSEIIDFKLNRPFLYVIYDSQNVPLFVGVITNPIQVE